MVVMLQAKVSSLYDLPCRREFAHRHESDANLDQLDIDIVFGLQLPPHLLEHPPDPSKSPHLL
jgi:hypothetical protein